MSNLKKSLLIGTAGAGAALFASAFFSILATHAACTNPTTIPTGFAAPCPVFSLSATSLTQAQTLTLSATPQPGTDYIYTTAYVSQGTAWNPYTLAGNNAYPSYSSALASLTLSSTQLQALSLGTHYAVSWDWLWDATAGCYKGPGLNQCNTGQWRVQSFSLTSSATPTPTPTASPYTYSQSAYVTSCNLALNKPTTESSEESATYTSANAVDGSLSTRWGSAFSDPQWITVDLQSAQSINQVVLNWEVAYASAFQVQVSSDNTNWTTVYTTTTGTGGTNTINFPATSARYVRMYGTKRATAWGYSLYEFQVINTASSSCSSYTYSQSPYYAYSQSAYVLPSGYYTTSFPRTENPISEGGVWINGGTTGIDWHNCRTTAGTPGLVFGTQPGTISYDDSTCLVAGTWAADQTAQATVRIVSSDTTQFEEVELRLRSAISAHSNTGYEINCSVKPGDPYLQIVRWNGALGNFTLLDARSVGCANGDILKATITGSTITAYKNGTAVFSVTDGTFSSGRPGIGLYIQNGSSTTNADFGFSSFTAQNTGSTYTYSQSSYYVYSQSSYYTYSQSSYTSYTYSQSSYYAYSQSAYIGNTITAASCSQTDVQNAINAASAGYTVNVPAGSCTWTSVTLAKAITLQGAGTGQTNITVNSNPSFTINKQTAIVRVRGFTFSSSGNNNLPHPIVVQGTWSSGQPVIFQNNAIVVNGSTMFDVLLAGGVIFSHNTFSGQWNDFFMTVKDLGAANSWTTADSMGTRDTNGLLNIYVEDNTFNGVSNGILDCDDNCRMVLRHNTFNDSGGYNSHGLDSSNFGTRHFEIYNNSFLFPDKTCTNGQTSQSNINQYIWLRGATGVIFNNAFDALSSQCWGTKPIIKFSIRGAEDDRKDVFGNSLACSATTYPVPHQLGQNNNGTSNTAGVGDFRDPIYIWGNTGTGSNEVDGWGWGNPCGFTWSTFFQWGRDAINQGLQGGSAKPGYTPYTYPHPLAQ